MSMDIYQNSLIVRHLTAFYKKSADRVINYLRNGPMAAFLKDTKIQLRLFPVRTTSTVLVAAVAVNMLLLSVLGRQINLYGWLMRGLLLSVGIAGLSCKADWPTVKANSIILRFFHGLRKRWIAEDTL